MTTDNGVFDKQNKKFISGIKANKKHSCKMK